MIDKFLNKFVRKRQGKIRGLENSIAIFQKGYYTFRFDLKSGYHHIDIFATQQTFLGFSLNNLFCVFTVLPLGLSSATYILTF